MSIDIAKARQLIAAATDGPWKACQASDARCSCGLVWSLPADAPIAATRNGDGDGSGRPEDASFIAFARDALPAALDRIEQLQALIVEQHSSERIPLRSAMAEKDRRIEQLQAALVEACNVLSQCDELEDEEDFAFVAGLRALAAGEVTP